MKLKNVKAKTPSLSHIATCISAARSLNHTIQHLNSNHDFLLQTNKQHSTNQPQDSVPYKHIQSSHKSNPRPNYPILTSSPYNPTAHHPFHKTY